MKTTIYTPDSSLAHPWTMIRSMWADMVAGQELAVRLALRDIRAQCRQTYLGFAWAFIMPVVSTLAWVFLNASGIVQLQETDIPYPVYAFIGTMLWAFLIESMNAPIAQTSAAKAMLTKLNFPREALLLAGLYKILFNGAIKVALLLCVIPFFSVYPSGSTLFLFPFALIALMLFGTAIGLLMTPIGMLYKDIGRAIPLVMGFVMYLTPVVFPLPTEGFAARLFMLNPCTPLILAARSWLVGAEAVLLPHFFIVTAVSLLILTFALIVYRIAMPILIERMGG